MEEFFLINSETPANSCSSLAEKVATIKGDSLSPNTKKSYRADLKSINAWRLSVGKSWPLTPEDVVSIIE